MTLVLIMKKAKISNEFKNMSRDEQIDFEYEMIKQIVVTFYHMIIRQKSSREEIEDWYENELTTEERREAYHKVLDYIHDVEMNK